MYQLGTKGQHMYGQSGPLEKDFSYDGICQAKQFRDTNNNTYFIQDYKTHHVCLYRVLRVYN